MIRRLSREMERGDRTRMALKRLKMALEAELKTPLYLKAS
jgi:hypothetical protein